MVMTLNKNNRNRQGDQPVGPFNFLTGRHPVRRFAYWLMYQMAIPTKMVTITPTP